MDLNLQELCERVEDCYPRSRAGDEVFSRWAQQAWSEGDYACPGFAFRYTANKFVARAEATHELLTAASRQCEIDLADAEIFDVSAGPGCAAAGAAKFLLQSGVEEPRVSFFDPVLEWEPATRAFQSMGIEAEFELCPSLEQMVESFEERVRRSSGPLVVCISHVLQDFGGGGQELADWWKALQQASRGRRLIVLVLERSFCQPFLPERLPGGFHRFAPEEKLPSGTDNSSFCAALFLPLGSVQVRRQRAETSGASRPTMSGVMVRQAALQPAMAPQSVPSCPECHGLMVKRTNRRGYNPGSQFWGCSRYPDCEGKRRA